MTMYVKIHKSVGRQILAVCDENLIGRTFEEKDLQLYVSEDFYKGEIKSEYEVLKLFDDFDNMSLVGENIIKLAIKAGILSRENVIYIKKIPHAQIYSL